MREISLGEDIGSATVIDKAVSELSGDMFVEDGGEGHLFWQAKSYESNLLAAPKDNSPFSHGSRLTHVTREYALDTVPDRVEMRVKLRPMGLDIIDSLIESGDLVAFDTEIYDTDSAFDNSSSNYKK